ncbi:MAG: DUF1934 domain-containing protein [Clostridia bacterium]|nr:DUF1934 domain-containing protein [Clostridia bacterium]
MKCKIKITTIQADYKGKSIFERAASELLISESFSDYYDDDKIETLVFGEALTQGDEFIIRYEENGEGMLGVKTELKFNVKNPSQVSLVRTGEIDSFMSFEAGKRHICVYNTGIMPFEICIYSKSVDNRLLTDGIIEINYLVEIKGACAQKTIFKMEVEKL